MSERLTIDEWKAECQKLWQAHRIGFREFLDRAAELIQRVSPPPAAPKGTLTANDATGWYRCCRKSDRGYIVRYWCGRALHLVRSDDIGSVLAFPNDYTDFIPLVPAGSQPADEHRLALCSAYNYGPSTTWEHLVAVVRSDRQFLRSQLEVYDLPLTNGWSHILELLVKTPVPKKPRLFKAQNHRGPEYDAVEWTSGRVTIRDGGGWGYTSLAAMKESGWSEVETEGDANG